MVITSVNNKHVKDLVKLKDKKYRDQVNVFLVETFHLVMEALKNGSVREIIVSDGYDIDTDVDKIYVSDSVMKKISSTNTNPKVIAVCDKIEERDISKRLIILDNIQDPGNLGAIIRSAVAFNFDTIVLSDDCVDLYNPKVLRASEGMVFSINVLRKSLVPFVKDIKDCGYLVVGTDVNNGSSVKDISLEEKYAFVIGNEGMGMSDDIKKLCDSFIYIDINKKCESLNASVAASIIMYELNNK